MQVQLGTPPPYQLYVPQPSMPSGSISLSVIPPPPPTDPPEEENIIFYSARTAITSPTGYYIIDLLLFPITFILNVIQTLMNMARLFVSNPARLFSDIFRFLGHPNYLTRRVGEPPPPGFFANLMRIIRYDPPTTTTPRPNIYMENQRIIQQ